MNPTLVIASVGVGIAVLLLTWSLFETGIAAASKHRLLFTERTRFRLSEMFLFIDSSRLYVMSIALVMLAGIGVWLATGALILGIAAAILMAYLPKLLLKKLRERRLLKLESQLPDALQVMAGGLRAGIGLVAAFQQVVRESRPPLSQEFDLVLREVRLGVTLDEALENLSHRVSLQAVTLFVSAMRIANETGGNLAEALERTAETLRSKLGVEGKIRALTAQGKLQAWIVGLMPVLLLFVLTNLEGDAMRLLWETRMGWATLAVVGMLEFFGVWLIRKIVAIDV